MKILLCSEQLLSKELGISKALIELAEELEVLGWQCQLVDPSDVDCNSPGIRPYTKALTHYLQKQAGQFDVVDYPYIFLPSPIAALHQQTLFVARSALLVHHFETIHIPSAKDWRSMLSRLVKALPTWTERRHFVTQATKTIREADLINVNNNDDKNELIKRGIPAGKIVVLPLGISRDRWPLFEAVSSEPPKEPTVGFVGTFDNRKGAIDFPAIVKLISSRVPNVRFRLLGTRRASQEVLKNFPQELQHNLDVIPTFQSTELPSLLADCSIGIFPSYIEGFGFGVLEMLAASVPVIAYNAPGPPMMLPPEYLVPRGDIKSLSEKVINLLHDREQLKSARLWAKHQSQQFRWQYIAKSTSETYLNYLELKRAANPPN
jgi:glycosyltransferase involved in cell wall biosynthesis